MKRLFAILAATLLTTILWAQNPPQKMSYQAVVRNTGGVLVANQSVGMKISILQGSPTGTLIYQEIYNLNPQTNANGLVTIEIGGGIPLTGTFSTIDWSSGPYFLKTETDPAGGINYTISGTNQLLSVPYALHAKTAADIPNLDWSKITSGKPTTLSGYGITDAVNTTGNQTIEGNKTFTGTTTVPTPVNATDAATKAYVDALLQTINQLESQPGILKDVDGNLYTTIKIGTQVWMSENLKTTKHLGGTAIPLVTDNTAWSNLTTPGYCWYDNNSANKDIYGALYNWYTVNIGKLCPSGWHVPTDAEWTTLENYLIANGFNYDGTTTGNKIAKALASTTLWTSSTTTGAVGNTDYPTKRNSTGFTALPGGYRGSNGTFDYVGNLGNWWSATEYDATDAWYRLLSFNDSNVYRHVSNKKYGFSVRCVRD